jgi:hypothetical protein
LINRIQAKSKACAVSLQRGEIENNERFTVRSEETPVAGLLSKRIEDPIVADRRGAGSGPLTRGGAPGTTHAPGRNAIDYF